MLGCKEVLMETETFLILTVTKTLLPREKI